VKKRNLSLVLGFARHFSCSIFCRREGGAEVRSLGLDVGDKRTGVAISDPQGILATPLAVLTSNDEDALIDEILRLVEHHKAERIVIGLPRRLNGKLGQQADKVGIFADKLSCAAKQRSLSQPDIQLWDERLSTRAAERLKPHGGTAGKLRREARRGSKNRGFSARAGVDAIAAAFILQGFLDSHRQSNDEGP
jgi:putative Holliday junction resolvase